MFKYCENTFEQQPFLLVSLASLIYFYRYPIADSFLNIFNSGFYYNMYFLTLIQLFPFLHILKLLLLYKKVS